ncbi:RNA polymerase sigma factor [Xanthovirga aplysinae]|uniref:RNA polymerase sigma factor n=1 Tax=Xanthovirga aplysinae TaxID=2529853 RepID=UPI0012BD78FF|nr:RNA polymerase sigma factor [Xanthovirga aplysinae]MTI30228.1 RNA polymerase sigma factor [Xanthovirga aplysinae]
MSETDNSRKLKAFFGKEYDQLKSYVISKFTDSADRDAEDIIQDVALKLFSRADTSSPINNVAGFVYHSIRNKIIDLMRTKKQTTNIHDESESRLVEFVELFYGKADNSYSEQMKHELIKTISELKPHYKQIIIAIDFEGFSYRELSLKTGAPEGTLMSRRHRALSILKKQLKKNVNT